jgi:predicted TIM-barrel fold metal-dependent hydrolase
LTQDNEATNGAFDIRHVGSRREVPQERPLTIVSADSHVVAPARDYIDYLDPQYRVLAADYIEYVALFQRYFDYFGYPWKGEVLDVVDRRGALRAGGELGTCDPGRRLRECEAEGVVAELLHPNSPLGAVPFFSSSSMPVGPELRAAGARAHNRFLADFCSVAPDRLIGVRLIYPWPDIEAAVQECRKAAAEGARAIYPPQQAGVDGDVCPPLYDPSYDPLWAACQELGLSVHIHAGWGTPQLSTDKMRELQDYLGGDAEPDILGKVFETFVERRPLWQFIWGGVFDRFPRLKIVFVEVHCDWVPPTLVYLDDYAQRVKAPLRMSPTEYWQRHCAVGASIMRHSDVAVRHEVGLSKVMFGTDYPHVESSFPNNLDFLRTLLDAVPEDEVRKIVGGNAIAQYGLDRLKLDEVAAHCGPLPSQVIGMGHIVDPQLVDHFQHRSGIRKPPALHEAELAAALKSDSAAAGAARSRA